MTMPILTPGEVTQPRIVTEAQLQVALLPLLGLDRWAQDTIGDLWRKGAPVPQRGPDGEEMRILLPTQFRTWFNDVAQRVGIQGEQWQR